MVTPRAVPSPVQSGLRKTLLFAAYGNTRLTQAFHSAEETKEEGDEEGHHKGKRLGGGDAERRKHAHTHVTVTTITRRLPRHAQLFVAHNIYVEGSWW